MEKKVTFSRNITMHYMNCWTFAYKVARQRYWENVAIDRARFRRRIKESSLIIEDILTEEHRCKIYKERFE